MILKAIKAALKAKGLPEKWAERIMKTFKIESEEVIDGCIDLFKENILPGITEAETAAQEAARTSAISEYEKTHNLKDGKPIIPPVEEPPVDTTKLSPEMQAIFAAQSKQIGDLTAIVTGMATTQQRSQKLEIIKAKMKGKVDDEFLDEFAGRVDLNAENLDTAIESQIESYSKLAQKFINKAVADGTYEPASGSVTDNDFDGFLKVKSESGSDFKGVEI